MAVLLTLSAVLVAPVQVSASSSQTYVFVGFGTMSVANVTVHGQKFAIEAMDLRSTLGPIDLIMVSWMTEGGMAWVAITDNDEFSESWFGMDILVPAIIVCKRDLEVWSWFRRVTVVLRKPVTVPDGPTIHPFILKLRGHGWGELMEDTMSHYPGYTIYMRSKTYGATAIMTRPEGCEPIEEASVSRRVKIVVTAP